MKKLSARKAYGVATNEWRLVAFEGEEYEAFDAYEHQILIKVANGFKLINKGTDRFFVGTVENTYETLECAFHFIGMWDPHRGIAQDRWLENLKKAHEANQKRHPIKKDYVHFMVRREVAKRLKDACPEGETMINFATQVVDAGLKARGASIPLF